MSLLIITGMSGAGKSIAMVALEDAGYFCVDNVPPKMILKFVELMGNLPEGNQKMALCVDSRSFSAYSDFTTTLLELNESKIGYRMIFLDCSTTVILNRYKENRRNHPLYKTSNGLELAIKDEKEMLEPIRQLSQYLIDTTHSNIKELKHQISEIVAQEVDEGMIVQCMSFGFKYGMPMDPDLVFDVRFLANPFYLPELKDKTGLQQEVSDYVMKSENSRELLSKLLEMFDFLLPLYKKEGKTRLVIAIGCTGGKHRSVTFAEEIFSYLKQASYNAVVTHRDINRIEH